MTPSEYDFEVFRITAEVSKQVFPVTLDLDNPAFAEGLERLRKITAAMSAAKAQGGMMGKAKMLGLRAAAFVAFARLYLLPGKHAELPATIRLQPAW